MKLRRSILEMTRQAIVRRPLLLVTIDAKTHRVIDDALGDRHLRQVPMTRGAIHLRANMRRMVESQMRFFDKSINALPWHVFAALRMIAKRLNSRVLGVPNILMTRHTVIDTG